MNDDTKRCGRVIFTAVLLLVASLALPHPTWAQIPPCGDGTLDAGEECDEGPATGAPDSCCAIDCTFRPASTPCRDATGECDPADVCSGTSGVCVDVKRTDVCRPAAGVCDVDEVCDGVASDCPADVFAPGTVECRASAGVCDLAEHCSGASAACPADAKSTSICRPSAGVCDVGETCDGVGNACPADGFVAATFVCRAAAGVCDVAEHCTGSSAPCPIDAFAAASVECRAAAGVCDAAEQCTGSSATCPADVNQPDETPCDDGNVCSTNDRCIGGVCGGYLEACGNGIVEEACAEECDDGNFDVGDGCDASCRLEPCGPAPISGCRAPTKAGKAAVQIISRVDHDKNRMQWKYAPGAATPKEDFGNPIATTSYQFCMYEEIGDDPRLAASYAIPAGGICGTVPCWKASSSGFKYLDKAHVSQGIAQLVLKQGLADGKTKITVRGKGANLPVPVLPFIQSPNVVMQLKASNGICWEARYGMPAFRNQPDQFRDK
jgi:cysteine-rich repeat protein